MEYEKIEKELSSFLEGTNWLDAKRNRANIHVTWLDPSPESIAVFNRAYNLVASWRNISQTKSGGIAKSGIKFRYFTKSVEITKSSYELTIIAPSKCYILRFRHDFGKGEEGKLAGKSAFANLRRRCKARGFELSDLAIPNGKQVKETIPAPDIRLIEKFKDQIIRNTFHIDMNSAYMAGIQREFGYAGEGKFGAVIQDIYDHRHDNTKTAKYNKAILNCSQGYMQSQYCVMNRVGYSLSHLAKAGIVFCKNRLQELIAHYEGLGCELIATNTDGAWFTINGVPETKLREGTSELLGEHKIDHWNCTLRYKTKGAYEYIENGVYTVRMRGKTRLDRIKPRTMWEWGDIYKLDCQPIKYKFIKEEGIVEL